MSTTSNTPSKTFKIGGDLEVNRLGFGAMRIVGQGVWGPYKDPEAARTLLRRVVELGINFIDTADAYGPAVSEVLIGEALAPYAPVNGMATIIATKGGLTRQGPNKWLPVGRPEYLIQEVELSLRYLKRDILDLWQLHRIDPKTPIAESLGAIKDLQTAGKIKHVGLSEVTVAEIEEARKTIEIVSVQNKYNLGDRASEPVLEYCQQHNIAFIPWAPVAGGKLVEPGGKLDAIAKKYNATVSQICIAWLLHRSPVILPIPGTTSIPHLEENLKAADLTLTEEDWQQIEAAAL